MYREKVLMVFSVIFVAAGLGYTGALPAQEAILDFYGEVRDAEHPPGYRDFVEMGCWQCHGFQGQGASAMALINPLIPYEAFSNQVRRPRNVMPAYSQNVLREEKLRNIYNYLENVPASPDPDAIPLLSGE
jgi:mono/diheme cytochrome c family protein